MTAPARGTILVVDDDDDTRGCVALLLEGEGFVVEIARNGRDALGRLGSGPRPDLVLLDMMMPEMNGWDVLEAVARAPDLQSLPIVLFTAAGSLVDPGTDLGRPVLRKPIDLDLLLTMVERFCAAGWEGKGPPSDLLPKRSG